MKKKKIILTILTTVLVSTIAIFCGYFTGTNISNKYFAFDKYKNLTGDNYEEDISRIQYQNKLPNELTPAEVFLVAIHLLESSENYSKDTFGKITTSVGVDQYVHSINSREGIIYTQQYCSTSSLIQLAGSYQFKHGENIHLREGIPEGNTLNTVEWSDHYRDYTYEEYSENLGRDPIDECGYIVSSKTVLNSSITKNDNNEYAFTITLDPLISTIKYVNEVAYMSGIDKNTISFNSLSIEFTVDKNYKFLKQFSYENFSMKFSGIPVTVNAIYESNFTY